MHLAASGYHWAGGYRDLPPRVNQRNAEADVTAQIHSYIHYLNALDVRFAEQGVVSGRESLDPNRQNP
jgi:hypothetical protein